VHHLGPKDQILAAALQRANEVQEAIGTEWLRRNPHLTVSQWFRKWWRWINESPSNLAVTRLGYEAVTLDATVTGLSAQFRADQISLWMRYPEEILVRSGMPRPEAKREAVLAKAVFTGLVLDLLASGDRQRLTRALEDSLEFQLRGLLLTELKEQLKATFSTQRCSQFSQSLTGILETVVIVIELAGHDKRSRSEPICHCF
jgi:hypothetical protein